MSLISDVIRRELRVSCSRRAQPVWFRITKWIVFAAITVALYQSRWFWTWIVGMPVVALLLHLFYRWKTRVWTRPWGGWDDVEAGRG